MKNILILLIASAVSFLASAQVLILQFSDTHSIYDNMEEFAYKIQNTIEEFKKASPEGEILFLHSGDISGPSEYTKLDKGVHNYDFFTALTKDHHFALTMGNHDGMDWNFDTFSKQQKSFNMMIGENSQYLNSEWKMIAANVELKNKEIKSFFRPYQDIKLNSGKTIRVVGLVLDKLLSFSGFDVIDHLDVNPMLEVAKQQLEEAYQDKVDRVIFSAHQELSIMKVFEKDLAAWIEENPHLKEIKSNLFFAAHDHAVMVEQGQHALIVDSGTGYQHFSSTQLNKKLELEVAPIHYSTKGALAETPISYELGKVLDSVKLEMDKVAKFNDKVLASNPIDLVPRGFVKKAPHVNGVLVAEALRKWSVESIKNSSGLMDSFAFFNSGSYRSNELIKKGDFTYGNLMGISPYTSDAKLMIIKGEDIQKMYESLRSYLPGEHTPQVSANLKEYPLGSKKLYHLNPITKQWQALDQSQQYSLALDHWLGNNGFRIPEFEQAFNQSIQLAPELRAFDEVMLKYFPALLEARGLQMKAFCEGLYK